MNIQTKKKDLSIICNEEKTFQKIWFPDYLPYCSLLKQNEEHLCPHLTNSRIFYTDEKGYLGCKNNSDKE